jgi:DNA polymerase III epsilon subunit-like protein
MSLNEWTSLSYVVVDVEGNGHQPPELVELAVVPIRGGVIGKPASWLVKPDHPIKYFTTQLHGLTTADVADCPKLRQIAAEVQAALAADTLIAHNAHVDVGVLQRELSGWQPPEVFDTLRLARRLVPDLDSYRLGNLVRRFQLAEGLPDGLKPHRAAYDALVAARLFVLLARRAGSLEALRGVPPEGGDDPPALF